MSNSKDDVYSNLSFSYKSQAEIRRGIMVQISKMRPSDLTPEQIFDVVEAGLELEIFIPEAISVIESGHYIDFVVPYKDEYSILDQHTAYFSKNPIQKKRYERLKLWHKNRGNCISPKTGKARKSYHSEGYAIEAARHMTDAYGEQVPVKCDSCGQWHLTPESRHTPSQTCEYCTDSDGNSKQLYFTREGAIKRSKIRANEHGLHLKVYKCPHKNGWHLTKG